MRDAARTPSTSRNQFCQARGRFTQRLAPEPELAKSTLHGTVGSPQHLPPHDALAVGGRPSLCGFDIAEVTCSPVELTAEALASWHFLSPLARYA